MEGKGRLHPDFIASNLYFFEAKFTLLVGGLLDRVLATPSREGGEKGSRVSAPPPFNLTVFHTIGNGIKRPLALFTLNRFLFPPCRFGYGRRGSRSGYFTRAIVKRKRAVQSGAALLPSLPCWGDKNCW